MKIPHSALVILALLVISLLLSPPLLAASKQASQADTEVTAEENSTAPTDNRADASADDTPATQADTAADTPTDAQTGTLETGDAAPAIPQPADHDQQIQNSMANIEAIQKALESMRSEVENSKESANLNRNSVQTIRNGLELIDSKLKEAYSDLDESRNSIARHSETLEALRKEVVTLTRDLRATSADSEAQNSLIEDNSVRLYEILLQITAISDKINEFENILAGKRGQTKDMQQAINGDLNRLWMLLSIVLVFFTPLAFILAGSNKENKPLPDGTSQQQGMVLACLGVFLGYFLLGFGLMYGQSASGWIGLSSFLIQDVKTSAAGMQPIFSFTEFVMYQTGFAMLSVLIVYVAIGHRISSTAHMMLALFVGAVLMPVFGHWAWSGYFIPNNNGWLQGAGFIDQAGSTTISSVSAWFALVIVWRMGKDRPSSPEEKGIDEPVYSSTATQLLWLSWLGFTTGTLPISSEQIPSVMLNSGLAASAGGMTAFLHHVFFHTDQGRIARGLSGFVSGLVAIAACAQSVTFAEAAIIGALAGLLQNMAFKFLRKSFLSQAWQIPAAYLVAIHGIGGVWGTLCVALFGTEGNLNTPNTIQLATQIEGISAALAYSILLGNVIAGVLMLKRNPASATPGL